MLFRGCFGVLWDVPGLFRAVPGCSVLFQAVPGMFWGVPGVFRGVPGCSGVFRVLQTPGIPSYLSNVVPFAAKVFNRCLPLCIDNFAKFNPIRAYHVCRNDFVEQFFVVNK